MSLIAEPATVWYAGQTLDFDVTGITLANGRLLADFDTFTLTVWEDPHWPRRAFQNPDEDMDPANDGWGVALSEEGVADDLTTVSFDPTSLETALAAGEKRYAYGVIGEISGSPPTRVTIVPVTWLTVYPSAAPPP